MLVGARIIKTGIAVIFAIYISQWFHLDTGIGYIVASSVLAIQPSVYRSWRQLIENIEANLVGAAIVIGGISLFGNHPAVIGLIIILVISINLRLHLERSLDLSIFVVIALAYSSGNHYAVYALHRFLFIMVGISFATLINMFLLPPNHQKRVFNGIRNLRSRLSLLLRLGATQEVTQLPKASAEVRRDMDKLNDVYRLYLEERPVFRLHLPLSKWRTKVVIRRMIGVLNGELRLLELLQRFKQPEAAFAQHMARVMAYHERLLNVFEGLVTEAPESTVYQLLDENGMLMEGDASEELMHALWLTRDVLRQLQHLDKLIGHARKKV